MSAGILYERGHLWVICFKNLQATQKWWKGSGGTSRQKEPCEQQCATGNMANGQEIRNRSRSVKRQLGWQESQGQVVKDKASQTI